LAREKAEVGLIHLPNSKPEPVSACQMKKQLIIVTNKDNNITKVSNFINENKNKSAFKWFVNCWLE